MVDTVEFKAVAVDRVVALVIVSIFIVFFSSSFSSDAQGERSTDYHCGGKQRLKSKLIQEPLYDSPRVQ